MSDTSISYLKYLKYKAKYMQLKHELSGGAPLKAAYISLIWMFIIAPLKQLDTVSGGVKDTDGIEQIQKFLSASLPNVTEGVANTFITWLCGGNVSGSTFKTNLKKVLALANEKSFTTYASA